MTLSRISAAVLALIAGSAAAHADFIAGNLVVSSINGLTNAAQSVSLLEFTAVGANQAAPVSTVNLPTTLSGSNHRVTLSGSATSEGALTLSTDGRYLTIGGYDAAVATASVASTTSAAVPRVAARIASDGSVDSSTALTDAYSGNNIRSVASVDGSSFYTGGPSNGVRYATLGATTSTGFNTTNIRVVNIYNGQLYASSAAASNFGVGTVGTGLPTSGTQAFALLPGFPTSTASPYDFVFTDANTLFVADDRSVASGGGLQKWTQSGGTWTLATTYSTGLTSGLRGLTGGTDSTGAAVLYAVTADATANKLVSFSEANAAAGFTTLATAATGTIFRGVDFAPVPTPGTLVLGGMGLALAGRRRRR